MVPRPGQDCYAQWVVVFAGVDLAWSGRKPSGRCVLRGGAAGMELVLLDRATLDGGEMAGWLASFGDDVVAGVDAPLIVTESRAAEAALARVYGSRGVFAYAARPRFLEDHGIAEGPRLGAALQRHGWNLAPGGLSAAGRHALEVFPHATTVALFGAPRAIRYKRGPLAERAHALGRYRRLILAYIAAECPELMEPPIEQLLHGPVLPAPASALKELEDQVDALVCALAARHVWVHGADGAEVFGDASSGYIAVPVPPGGRQLATSFPVRSSP